MDKKYKKEHGIFFTPKNIVLETLSNIELNNYSKILEPSFGEGIFIDEIISSNLISPFTSVFGNELDSNLYTESLIKYKEIPNLKLTNKNYLTEFEEDGFDLIIGNPPYGSKITKDDLKILKCDLRFQEFGYEPSVLFSIKALSQLKEGGRLVFILPSTLLRVASFSNFRKYLKNNTRINRIINLHQSFPDVGYETFVLDVVLEKQKKDYEIFINNFETKEKTELSFKFIEDRNVIPIHLDKKLENIINKIEKNTVKLSTIAEMPRGIAISVSDNIILKKYKSNYIKLLTGRNIGKYYIKKAPEHYVPSNYYHEKYKEKKILSQNLAYKIVSALDTKGSLVNDTVNTIFINNKNYLIEYVLAILNSKLMIFYLQNAITNKAKLNIHLDTPYIGQIPIKKVSLKKQKEIKKLVEDLLKTNSFDLREMIEKKINEIYNIDENFDIKKYSIYGKMNI